MQHTVSNIKWPPSIKENTVFVRLDSDYEFSGREGGVRGEKEGWIQCPEQMHRTQLTDTAALAVSK